MRTPIDTFDDLDRLHSRYTREAAVLISEAAAGDDDNQALRETIGGGEVIFIFNFNCTPCCGSFECRTVTNGRRPESRVHLSG